MDGCGVGWRANWKAVKWRPCGNQGKARVRQRGDDETFYSCRGHVVQTNEGSLTAIVPAE